MMKSLISFLFVFFPLIILSQNTYTLAKEEYYRENYIRYINYIYEDNIQTLVIHPEDVELADPVLLLNSDDKIVCTFDDLKGGVENYMYTFIHCDANWKPSDIKLTDYLEGYTEDYIRDYKFSFNTLLTYTHYSLVFPSEQMKFKISGNYIILIYPENKRDQPIISARFFVNENQLRIEGKVRQAVNLEERYEKQQLQFSVFSDSYGVVNPFQNLLVFIRQNGRTDNIISNLKPLMVKGDEISYQHVYDNIFDGGNEFRYFEIKTIKYPSDRVQSVNAGETIYHASLMKDERRSQKAYITEGDINGRRVIRTSDGTEPDVESDYLMVHFVLPFSPYYSNGNIYVYGELTNWQYSKKSMMTYNFQKKQYELDLMLKQGYYNYVYMLMENGQNTGDISFIEGNHFETKNDYTIFIYYREPGALYDKLVGLTVLQAN